MLMRKLLVDILKLIATKFVSHSAQLCYNAIDTIGKLQVNACINPLTALTRRPNISITQVGAHGRSCILLFKVHNLEFVL
jgi:ketopantoate reductase